MTISEIDDVATATVVRETLHRSLAAAPKSREPMNALVIWTELGRGLAGTLEEVGAERGLLRKLIVTYCMDHGAAAEVDLSRWAYRLESDERLEASEAAAALQRAESDLSEALGELALPPAQTPEARRALFITVVKGWFPVGLDIIRSLPAARAASAETTLGALAAWCARYLPDDASEEEIAPLVTREESAAGKSPKIKLRTI